MNRASLRPAARLVPLLAMVFGCGAGAAFAADWPNWLGPNRDGRATGLAASPGENLSFEIAWKHALGRGYTGIAVAGGRAVTMFADGTTDWVVSFDARTGAEQWKYAIDAMYPSMGGSEGGPSGMPVVADGVVYGVGAKGHLFAIALADGRELWKVRIDEALGGRPPRFGFSTAPLVAGDVLFVQTGGDAGRSLAGFDRRTGKVLWSTSDDTAGYASPILADFSGVQQIVAMTDRAVYGLAPTSGAVLWSREHAMMAGDDATATPVLIGGDRFFLTGDPDSRAFAVTKEGEAWRVEEAWNTRAMKGSLATPVFHDAHLYGFDGDFLTCISATDGTKVWKSRPPGGRGLILVDGHLLILANDGAIVGVEATPEGYRETGRMAALAAGTWTYPSFADGLIFVRNTTEIAAISVRAAAPTAAATAAASPPPHAFARFVQRVEQSQSKRLLVDDFMTSQGSFPALESGWVHFLYRGPAEDVAITGSMTEWQVEEPLARISGTDLFHRSYAAGPGTRWEYRLNVDFENAQPDPLNPRRVPGSEGDLSEVTTAGWKRSAWLSPYAGQAPGRLESFDLSSKILEGERTVEVYLPAGYGSGSRRYPLVVALDGQGWRDRGQLPNVLDHLVQGSSAPVIVALVHSTTEGRGEFGGAKIDDYVKMLAEELVPELDTRYRTIAKPEQRATLGAGSAGTYAAYAALAWPGVFAKAAITSPFLGRVSEKLTTAVESFDAAAAKPIFEITWHQNDLHRAAWNADIARDSKLFVEQLEQQGFRVHGREVSDSSGWGAWPVRAGEMLSALFPGG